MSESDTFTEIVHHLVGTAQAHHEATGGVNPGWARWYAEHLVDDLNEKLGSSMELDELADWLEVADRRYREEPQEHSWPKAYAAWLMAEQQSAG
jgi:hypothetical protein